MCIILSITPFILSQGKREAGLFICKRFRCVRLQKFHATLSICYFLVYRAGTRYAPNHCILYYTGTTQRIVLPSKNSICRQATSVVRLPGLKSNYNWNLFLVPTSTFYGAVEKPFLPLYNHVFHTICIKPRDKMSRGRTYVQLYAKQMNMAVYGKRCLYYCEEPPL